MPPIIAAIVFVIEAIGISAAVAGVLAPMILSLGVSLVLGEISKMFANSSRPTSSSLATQIASRTVTSRQAIAPRRVQYGVGRLGGIITFLHTTGTNNEKLHIVITLAGHELFSIGTMYFDGVAVPLDGSGNATGNFAGFVHAEFNLGTRGQASFPGLVAAAPAFWTSAHRQRGCAGAYVALTWDVNKFPNGVPNITFDVQGRKVYDPRTGTIAYSNNAALCIADYLNNSAFGLVAQTKYAVTAAMLTNSGFSGFNAAQLVDGDTTTNGWSNNTTNIGSTVSLDLGAGVTAEFRRCRMYLSVTGQVQTYDVQFSDNNSTWTTAAAAFLPDIIGWNDVELAPNGAHRYWRIKADATITEAGFVNELEFYTSDVDSVQLISAANTSDEAVNILAGGTEPRFTINGSFDTSEAPAAVVGRMNSAIAGSAAYIAGLWGIFPGIWRAPTISLTDSDLRGPMTVQTRMPHRDLYNGVKGTYISALNNWQISDYPPFQSPAYLLEDNNEPLWLDVELPFTTSGATAQRLSKIALRRARRQTSIQAQFKLTAYQAQALDVIQFSHPRFGWVNKTFEVTGCTLIYGADSAGAMAVGVDLTLREADSTIYDWTTADEVAINAPPTTILPSNLVCQPPTAVMVSASEIVRTADGIRTNFIALAWTAPADQFVLKGGHIIIQYKKHTDALWTDHGKRPGDITTAQIGPILDGIQYDIQMWAQNHAGVNSAAVTGSVTANGTAVTIDTLGDGITYGRPGSHGKNMCPNPGFEFNTGGTPVATDIALNGTVSDGWTVISKQTPGGALFAVFYKNGTPRSGAGNAEIRVNSNISIPATSPQYRCTVASRKIPIRNGDIVRVQGYFRWDSNIAIPAGLTIYCQIGLLLYDATDTLLTELLAQALNAQNGAYTLLQASVQVALSAVSYVRVECNAYVQNNTGSAISTPNGLCADIQFDDLMMVLQATAFDLTPINTSGHSTGGAAVTQSGTSKTILIAGSTIQFGDGTVAYNSGSVTPGAYGTFFIYADDPTYVGGAVTYIASANESDVYAANGRVYFGKITTAVGGGGASVDPPGSGGGRNHLF